MMASPVLNFRSVNPTAPRTLLLIHGGFSSSHEWDLVCETLHLASYHLLIPDLPGHGRSTSQAIPFDLTDTVALLADLVARHAKNGKADLVGMSIGGHVAILMAHKYPDTIGDAGLFLSGCAHVWPARGSLKAWIIRIMISLTCWISTCVPKSWWLWYTKKMDINIVDELYLDYTASVGYRLGAAVFDNMTEDMTIKERNWGGLFELTTARTCIVAGAKRDSVQMTESKGRLLVKGNPESTAYKVEGKVHAWNLQDPEVFARGIRAWMEREELPEEYISLI
jgi:pimeloyl-ACP methyl ester carboxylesterase